MLAHSKGSTRRDGEDVVGEVHVEAMAMVGEVVNNAQTGMRTR